MENCRFVSARLFTSSSIHSLFDALSELKQTMLIIFAISACEFSAPNWWGGDISWACSGKMPIPAKNSVLPLSPENKSAPASPHFSPDGGILIEVTGERGERRCGLAVGHRVGTSYTLHFALTVPPPVPRG